MQGTTTTFHDLPLDLVNLVTDMAPALTFTCHALLPLLTEEKRYQMLIDNGGDILFCRIRGVPQVVWTFNNRVHRRNGPAIQYTDGNNWIIHDNLHRLDGPAVEYEDGTRKWYVNGKYHRLDGPAVEDSNGNKQWWVDDRLHRIGKPAVKFVNGYKEWWVNGKRHRGDEPALDDPDSGRKEWWLNGMLHRTDAPAVTWNDRHQEWWLKVSATVMMVLLSFIVMVYWNGLCTESIK